MVRKPMLVASVFVAVAAFAVFVTVQDQPAATAGHHMGHAMPAASGEAACPMSKGDMSKMCAEHMKMMGMSEPVMMRCKMLCGAAIANNDPVAILAVKDDLKLTDDQIAGIATISLKARQDAEALLTSDQKKTLESLAGTPATMMDMCVATHGRTAASGKEMTCPVMGMHNMKACGAQGKMQGGCCGMMQPATGTDKPAAEEKK